MAEEITHFPSNIIHPVGTIQFPTNHYEYSSHLYRGKQLRPKYRAQGRMIVRRKQRDYTRAQFETLDDGA